jgi:hypothetical protein
MQREHPARHSHSIPVAYTKSLSQDLRFTDCSLVEFTTQAAAMLAEFTSTSSALAKFTRPFYHAVTLPPNGKPY